MNIIDLSIDFNPKYVLINVTKDRCQITYDLKPEFFLNQVKKRLSFAINVCSEARIITTEDLKNEIVSTCEIMFKQENKNKDNISNFDSKIHSIAVRGLEFYQEQRITRPKQWVFFFCCCCTMFFSLLCLCNLFSIENIFFSMKSVVLFHLMSNEDLFCFWIHNQFIIYVFYFWELRE